MDSRRDPPNGPPLFARAFKLADGTIVLPCDFCGSPAFEPTTHSCPGLNAALEAEMDRRIIEGG